MNGFLNKIKKNKNKLTIIIMIILAGVHLWWIYNYINYLEGDIVTELSIEEKEELAAFFEMEHISDKIQCARYFQRDVEIKVGPFSSKIDLLDCFEFKDDEFYDYIIERYEDRLWERKTIVDGEVEAFDFHSYILKVNKEYDIYIYKIKDKYYFELDYWEA